MPAIWLNESAVRRADFMGADFMGADFMGADFTGADFTGADFTGAMTAEMTYDLFGPSGFVVGSTIVSRIEPQRTQSSAEFHRTRLAVVCHLGVWGARVVG
jgi:hypothetical protein